MNHFSQFKNLVCSIFHSENFMTKLSGKNSKKNDLLQNVSIKNPYYSTFYADSKNRFSFQPLVTVTIQERKSYCMIRRHAVCPKILRFVVTLFYVAGGHIEIT